MVLLIVGYYFWVTVALTSDFLFLNPVWSIFPILHGIEIPYWGCMLG